MREEERSAAVINQLGIVGHAGEREHHLVNLGIAVSPHCHKVAAIREAVQQGDDALRVVFAREVVTRTMVEQVAEQHDPVGLLRLDGADQPLCPVRGTMDIGCDKNLHEPSFPSVTPQG